jgi:hypothetical protein
VDQFLEWVPLVGALGIGSVIGNWVGGGRARREVRSGILKALATTENKRYCKDPNWKDYPEFITAIRELETAALIARIPSPAVHQYVVFAEAARKLSEDSVQFFPGDESFFGRVDGYFDKLVRDSAEVLTQLAWSPWQARVTRRWNSWKLRKRALQFDDEKIRRTLAAGQKAHGVLPGPLGELQGIEDPRSGSSRT